jgi:sugar lactone lactonase YvrE
LAWDSSGSLYITDYTNSRVQKWMIGASVGVTIAGQANGFSGNDSQHLFQPVGLLLDSNDNLYVADRSNQRVQLWLHGASSGTVIAGVTGRN